MKNIRTMALIAGLAIASVHAQSRPVKMTFSGTGGASAIELKVPNTNTAEENVEGQGNLGRFTFRNVRTVATAPQSTASCMGLFFPSAAGGGVFRFQDGSLLKVSLTQGGDCIDLVQMVGHCTLTLKIIGGTGRFKNASGVLTYTETAVPILADYTNTPVYFTETGEITGTISGVAGGEDNSGNQQ